MSQDQSISYIIKKLDTQHAVLQADISSVKSDLHTGFQNVKSQLDEYKTSLEYTQGEVENIKQQVVKQHNFTNQVAGTAQQIVTQQEIHAVQIRQMQQEITKSSDYSRKINLLFIGIKETKGEFCEALVKEALVKDLKIATGKEMIFQDCHRLGKFNTDRTRPIIVKFDSLKSRNSVLAARKNLDKNNPLKIAEHFSSETESYRKALSPLIKLCKNKGKKATLVGDQLLVDSRRYRL